MEEDRRSRAHRRDLLEQRDQGHAQAWQKRCAEDVLGLTGQDGCLAISVSGESVDFDQIEFRVDDPIFRNAIMRIALPLNRLVQFSISFGKDLNEQRRDATNVRVCNDRPLRVSDKNQIGLNHVKIGEDDIARSIEDFSQRMLLEKVIQRSEQSS